MMKKAFTGYLTLSVVFLALSITSSIAAQNHGVQDGETSGGVVSTSTITAPEIYEHIKYLASDSLRGRFTGTPGARMAAQYIAAAFRHYGLKPVGDEGSYFQYFPFIAGIKLAEGNGLETSIYGRTRRWRVRDDFAPMAFSTNVESGDASPLQVAFVGYGISAPEIGYDDYADLDVKERLVLALRFTPGGDNPHSKFWRHAPFRAKALMARQHGAKAIAFIADTDDFKKNRLSQTEFDFSFSDSGIVAVGISRQVADELVAPTGTSLDQWQKAIDRGQTPHSRLLSGVKAKIQVDLVKDTKRAENVVGFLEGSDSRLRDEIIVIGAHHDHLGLGGHGSLAPDRKGEIHNGADDNASGVAGLLELAQAFAAHRAELKRSLLFITFSGEEEGLLGSNYYVKNPIFPVDRTVAMVNMDMIGRMRHNRLTVQGLGTSPGWKSLIEELNRAKKFDLRTVTDGTGPSDHSSFYLKNLPVLFFFTGVHSDYHKPSDDYDKINSRGEARVVEFVYDVVSTVQAWPAPPQFAKTKSRRQPAGGFRVSLGTIPDYGEEVEGLKLSGVREGSPAERAGLKAGDVIIRVADIKVKNIYDYTFALGELKAGEEVEIEVRRGGRSLVLRVVPERRG